MIKTKVFLSLLLMTLVSVVLLSGGPADEMEARAHPFAPITLDAADSMMSRLNEKERIAQLFVVRNMDSASMACGGYLSDVIELENKPTKTATGIPYYRGFDLIHSAHPFMNEAQLSATNNPAIVANYASAVGHTLRNAGFNFVIGPSLDILYNDKNPYTEQHSFGEDPETVLQFSNAYVAGLKVAGILSVVGNYPGLGNMDRGYEHEAPIVYSRKKQLYSTDLLPFKGLVNEGAQSIMIGNAYVPAIDSGNSIMASQSFNLNENLKNNLGYNGLVWADLTIDGGKSISSNPLEYFNAGNDIMVIEGSLERYVDRLDKAANEGLIQRSDIDRRCKRVIQAKIWSQKNQPKKKTPKRTEIDLELSKRSVAQNSFVLMRNKDSLLPIKQLDTCKIALVCISQTEEDGMHDLINRYAPADVFHIGLDNLEADYSAFKKKSEAYNLVIILASSEDDIARKRFGLGEHYQSVIERIAYKQNTCLLWSGNPKALVYVSAVHSISAILSNNQQTDLTNDFALQAIFGGRPITGRLKRRVGNTFDREFGFDTEKIRLAYGIPEEVGIRREFLTGIDEIVYGAIEAKATPGAQVWFSKDRMVVVDEAYGHHRYDGKDTVLKSDLYDLASITKIAASVASLMKLSQDSLFNLDYSLCDYLSEWVDTTEYMQMGMREILAHQAGLPAFIPFYASTLKKGVPRFDIYSLAQNDVYPNRVARELYINSEMPDKMLRQILRHKIKPGNKYKYSDVGYYFALRIIEKQSGMKLEDYVDAKFYKPLGMSTMTYRPLLKFEKSRITPTEYDRYFRNQLVHGDVHDPGAAMLGGVGGHAGLFSNANDLGKLMQMYLNDGEYGGQTYIDSSIIADFVRCQFCENDNRRGAGFDKPVTTGGPGPSCGCTDMNAFGHQGFTGTVTWADPRDQVVYVFLSNRVYPNAENRKLASMNIRTDIQQVFHDAIKKSIAADSAETQL